MRYVDLWLIVCLSALVLLMDSERARLVYWFEGQRIWRQWFYGVFLALFISLCMAVVLIPIALEWMAYFNF